MRNIDESKEMKKIVADLRKELCSLKHDEISDKIKKTAETNKWTAERIVCYGMDKLIAEYANEKIRCSTYHGVPTIRIYRCSLFDEKSVKKAASKFQIHQIQDVISSTYYDKSNSWQMAFQYTRK